MTDEIDNWLDEEYDVDISDADSILSDYFSDSEELETNDDNVTTNYYIAIYVPNCYLNF